MSDKKKVKLYDPATSKVDWFNVDDPVMGGISESHSEVVERGTDETVLIFSGNVSLENNGGFCSTRTEEHKWNLPPLSGFQLKVRGDGKRYKFTVRTGEESQGSYRHEFDTRRNKTVTHDFAIEDFEMFRRGTHLADAPPLDPSKVESIGILVSDKQAGDFELEIFGIWATKKPS